MYIHKIVLATATGDFIFSDNAREIIDNMKSTTAITYKSIVIFPGIQIRHNLRERLRYILFGFLR